MFDFEGLHLMGFSAFAFNLCKCMLFDANNCCGAFNEALRLCTKFHYH